MKLEGLRARPVVAVIGGATCTVQEADWAEDVGRRLAARGAVVVCGGRGGVMEAVCRGTRGAGGLSVGVLAGTDRGEANPYVDLVIPTGLGEARNALIIRTAQAVIAVGGAYGTLTEIGFALQRGIPVAGLGTWELVREGVAADAIFRASTPEEAVDWVLSGQT